MARLRGVAPSEVLGVGCAWCAYCLDEALMVREGAHARRRAEEAADEAARERRKIENLAAARNQVRNPV